VVGLLVGLEAEQPGAEQVVLDVAGERLKVALSEVAKATLVFELGDES
jgi:hypothetical protein